ncbi:MAG TPA: carboxypeptidase-like regulatory domain-containing protein [Pseudacidobacterium sp.]|jgi:hypothetical protein|nr:carboxypeptidase-like regulatory domain-containing protein [Pseudacidobacterium sp.]
MTVPNLRIKIGPAFALLIALLALPVYAQGPSAISGVIRDAKGAPQVGALVELLGPNLSVLAQTFTDDHGHYSLPQVRPGTYNIKATGSLFLPTLRENLRVLANSKIVVNLTLNTLYEAFRWLPAQPRQASEPQDDWTWTLRLSQNRPLLRLLEDGPLVVVSDGNGAAPALKARVTIRGGANEFGDGGMHNDFEVERSNGDGQQVLLRADLGQADNASAATSVNTSFGYARQLDPAHTLRAVVSFQDRPDIESGIQGQGLQAVVLRTAETMELMDGVSAEVGSELQAIHLGESQFANHPFAGLTIHNSNNEVSYHMATSPGAQHASEIDRENTQAPALTEKDGKLLLEDGLHQELSIAHRQGNVSMRMTLYRDNIRNPVINGGGTLSIADWNSGNLLYDPNTDLLKAAGRNYSANGMLAELNDKISDDLWLSFAYGMGNTLTMDSPSGPVTLENGIDSLHPHSAEMLSASMTGKVKRTGMQWRASYRWQPTDTVTPVDPFDNALPSPYLSFYVRQPIHCRMLPHRVEALIDVRNLLAQGYRPFITQDGSTLYFAQAERSVQGGLAFTF